MSEETDKPTKVIKQIKVFANRSIMVVEAETNLFLSTCKFLSGSEISSSINSGIFIVTISYHTKVLK